MNRGLMGVLAVVVGVAVYLQVQGDDDDLVAKGGREPRVGQAAPARGDRGAVAGAHADRATNGTNEAMPDWAAAALIQGLPAWQARAHSDEPAARAQQLALGPSAWGPAQPPAPPVVRQPPPAEVIEAPPAPVAPPFPHRWVGRFNEGAVLSGTESTWVVHAGDVIEGQWRVDQIDGQRLSLTYLPLNQTQQVVMR